MKKLLFLLVLLIGCTTRNKVAQITPQHLTCEYRDDAPLVDVPNPRLAWINIAGDGVRGQHQTAYRVRVASAREKLPEPDLWDSGKVQSPESNRIEYGGKPLQSREECWWQVRVWDKDGRPSDWSEPALWRMGLLGQDDWKAKWIGAPWEGEEPFPRPESPAADRPEDVKPAPLMRKAFDIDKKVAKAMAYVTGLGYFEFYVNGRKVGDEVLVPNQTNYGKRPKLSEYAMNVPDEFRGYKVMYLAWDITNELQNGQNVIGGIVGNGFYNPAKFWADGYGTPRFLAQVHITYEDGSEDVVVSDETWKAAKSPIVMNMVYYGEDYDARLEQEGWSAPGFDDSSWENVALRRAPYGKPVTHTARPDKVTERLKPLKIEKRGEGHYFVDFGKEISGWVRFKNIEGPEGHRFHVSFNGNEYSGENTYIFHGKGPAGYAPRFNWFVFSGVEITDYPGELKPENLVAEAVNTEIEETATFETSNKLFNEINTIWKRSQLDNMHGGIASDCPHRERSAYTGDGQVACPTVMHNYDAQNFYHKWIHDIYDTQIARTGYVPNGAPWQPGCGGGPGWGAAICVMPWHFYVQYGAEDILSDTYEAMKGYVRYMLSWTDEEGIMFSQRPGVDGKWIKWFNLGEWAMPGSTVPDEFVHTFYLWKCADITAKTARVLGNDEEAKRYAALAEKTRESFWKRFYDEKNGTYGNGGGNILALHMGMPPEQYPRVIEALKNNIKANKGHLDTGIFGTRFFFEVLAQNDLQELAYEAMNKTDIPSYGHWLEVGSTTTREHWDDKNSHNHPMFGGGLVWFYRQLAGMQADPENPGYRHIIFRPQPAGQLEYVEYSNRTPYGRAGIFWERKNGHFLMEVTVPVGSTATVYVPAKNADEVMESGKQADKAEGLEFVEIKDGYAVYEVVSGKYRFDAPDAL